MSTSKGLHTYAYKSCRPVKLTVTDSASAHSGVRVVLIGRYDPPQGSARLLVRQEQVPHLLELPAEHTDIAHVDHELEGEQELLELRHLLELTRIIEEVHQRGSTDQ